MTRPAVQEMPERERPLSEQYRLAANEWCIADGCARLLEEKKSFRLEQMKSSLIEALGPMPDNKAEREVKSSPEWEELIVEMVDARTKANLLKVKIKNIEMLERETHDRNHTIRAEMRMTGR